MIYSFVDSRFLFECRVASLFRYSVQKLNTLNLDLDLVDNRSKSRFAGGLPRLGGGGGGGAWSMDSWLCQLEVKRKKFQRRSYLQYSNTKYQGN